jgi:hypothetical protein
MESLKEFISEDTKVISPSDLNYGESLEDMYVNYLKRQEEEEKKKEGVES